MREHHCPASELVLAGALHARLAAEIKTQPAQRAVAMKYLIGLPQHLAARFALRLLLQRRHRAQELQAVANEGHAEVAQIFLVHDLEQVARDLVLHKLLRVQGKPQTGKPLADRRRAPV